MKNINVRSKIVDLFITLQIFIFIYSLYCLFFVMTSATVYLFVFFSIITALAILVNMFNARFIYGGYNGVYSKWTHKLRTFK